MANAQQTSFTSPGYDYSADVASIDQRRKLAEALRAQAMQGIPTPQTPAGGFTPRVSPMQGLEKLAQALMSATEGNRADEQNRELSAKSQADYAKMVSTGLRQLQGTPATPMQEDASSNVTPAQPAMAPDPVAAMGTFGAHPMGQQFMPMAMQGVQREALLADALRPPAAAPAAPAAPAGGGMPSVLQGSGDAPEWTQRPQQGPQAAPAPQAPQPPQPQQGVTYGGPAGGISMQRWLAQDPTGKSYFEQLAKDYTETQKPVADRGFGLKRWNPATQKYELASRPEDITAVKEAELAATQKYEPPVTLKTSEGREIQLSRPEYAAYQQSGQLPARYGGRPAQAPATQAPSAGPQAAPQGSVRAAGVNIGIPGLGQSQADVIGQHVEQAYKTDRAKGYVKMAEDMRGGWQNAQTQRGMLDRLDQLFQDPNIAKGATAESISSLKNVAAGMGIDIKGLSSEQAIQSITNEFAMQLRNPAGGAGMPGAMSDSDRKFLASIPPSLSKSPEGRKTIMDTMRRKLDRDQVVANMAIEYEQKHGALDLGFERQMRKFSNENPVFSTRTNGPTLSPATLEFLKKNGIAVPGAL